MNEMRYSVIPPHCFLLCSRQFNDMKCMHFAKEQLTQEETVSKSRSRSDIGLGSSADVALARRQGSLLKALGKLQARTNSL